MPGSVESVYLLGKVKDVVPTGQGGLDARLLVVPGEDLAADLHLAHGRLAPTGVDH